MGTKYHKIGLVPTVCNRWAIQDSRKEWWTGYGWTGNKLDRQLYRNEDDARTAYEEMLRSISMEMPVRYFEVPLKIAVYTNGVYDREDLMEYMQRAFEFFMDVAQVGTCPTTARGRTEVELNWDEIEDVTDEVEQDLSDDDKWWRQ